MERVLISCIIPVYNGELYLREAIDSILTQTYRPLEIIVVDDGSTDATHDVVASYGDRIRYVRQDNAGPAAARNHGLSLAQGEFVAFLDADDLWHPEKLQRQMALFRNRPEISYCATYVQNFWIADLSAEEKRFRDHRLTKPVPGYVTQTFLIRRALFNQVGLFDTRVRHGDAQDWCLRAAEKGAVVGLSPDVLVYRRLHQGNFSRRISAALNDHLRIVKASLDRRRLARGMISKYDFPN